MPYDKLKEEKRLYKELYEGYEDYKKKNLYTFKQEDKNIINFIKKNKSDENLLESIYSLLGELADSGKRGKKKKGSRQIPASVTRGSNDHIQIRIKEKETLKLKSTPDINSIETLIKNAKFICNSLGRQEQELELYTTVVRKLSQLSDLEVSEELGTLSDLCDKIKESEKRIKALKEEINKKIDKEKQKIQTDNQNDLCEPNKNIHRSQKKDEERIKEKKSELIKLLKKRLDDCYTNILKEIFNSNSGFITFEEGNLQERYYKYLEKYSESSFSKEENTQKNLIVDKIRDLLYRTLTVNNLLKEIKKKATELSEVKLDKITDLINNKNISKYKSVFDSIYNSESLEILAEYVYIEAIMIPTRLVEWKLYEGKFDLKCSNDIFTLNYTKKSLNIILEKAQGVEEVKLLFNSNPELLQEVKEVKALFNSNPKLLEAHLKTSSVNSIKGQNNLEHQHRVRKKIYNILKCYLDQELEIGVITKLKNIIDEDFKIIGNILSAFSKQSTIYEEDLKKFKSLSIMPFMSSILKCSEKRKSVKKLTNICRVTESIAFFLIQLIYELEIAQNKVSEKGEGKTLSIYDIIQEQIESRLLKNFRNCEVLEDDKVKKWVKEGSSKIVMPIIKYLIKEEHLESKEAEQLKKFLGKNMIGSDNIIREIAHKSHSILSEFSGRKPSCSLNLEGEIVECYPKSESETDICNLKG